MYKIGIVVIGYNRIQSLERLFRSLKRAEYGDDKVDLIISIDNSGKLDVIDFANVFSWDIGEKSVYTYPKRLGLREHVLHCGNFLDKYDAIIVLEDDVYVAPGFYEYAKEAVEFYHDDDRIAGISLYNHLVNVHCKRVFQPEYSQYDTYFMQFAQSWGQVWMKRQWNDFIRWFNANRNMDLSPKKYPQFLCNWPEDSWLKYHIMYCVENEKYFVYPYMALSTCFSENGENTRVKSNMYHVPFSRGVKYGYSFPTLTKEAVIYDVFFERKGLGYLLGIDDKELCVNLYGEKQFVSERYQLTMMNLSKKIIKSYALEFRPHEMNVILELAGNDIFLYDMFHDEKCDCINRYSQAKRFLYYHKISWDWRKIIAVVYLQFKHSLCTCIKKIKRK